MRHGFLRTALTAMHGLGAGRLFETLSRARGAILTLHHVREERRRGFAPNAHLSVSPGFLDDLLDRLRRRSIDIVAMDEVADRLRSRAGTRFVSVTFDDGYRDNLHEAVPVLRAHGAPFTIYVTSGFVRGTAGPWWENLERIVRERDRLMVQVPDGSVLEVDCSTLAAKNEAYEALIDFYKTRVPEPEVERHVSELCWLYCKGEPGIDSGIMNARELALLAENPLCTFGAHTATHRSLARLSEAEAEREIASGRDDLERMTGKRARHFAFPYGFPAAAGQREFELARRLGFETAVTTRRGVLYDSHAEHLTALPRISLNGHYQRMRYADALMSGLPTKLARSGRRLDVR